MTNDTIQLMEDAVQHLLPDYATEDDMYEALDNCAMTEQEVYAAIDRRFTPADQEKLTEEQLALVVREILFDAFASALETATVHKMLHV